VDTLEYITQKFDLNLNQKSPIEILKINRTIMAQTLNELGFRVGAEIGVAQGNHSKLLCENIPRLHLYCIDIWEKYPGYNEYTDRIDRYYLEAKNKLANYDCSFIKKFSMDAAKDFENYSLDFVYIDGAHDLKNVVDDLCIWTK
jgi:predicted O-methyltransferase YrrM